MNTAMAKSVDVYLHRKVPKPAILKDPTTIKLTNFWGSLSPTPEEWDQRNTYACGMITLNIKNTIGQGVKTDRTAAEAWKSLTDVHNLATGMGQITAENNLRALCHVDGADLGAHITAMREAWAKTTAQGKTITDTEFRLLVITSMPKDWNTFLGTLDSHMTLAAIITKLHRHHS